MSEEMAERRWHALRGCDRMLSGQRPLTMAEWLTALADSGYDLDTGPDFYASGGPVGVLEDWVAELLGTEAAAVFPTGTMAQQVALRCWAERDGNPTVAMHPLGHLEMHERRAYANLTGLRAVWPTREPRQPTAAEVRNLDEPFGTLVLELPLRDAGFVLPTWNELTTVVDAARERRARVHLDGARLWEATPYLGRDLPTVAGLADSVYVSFYKSLGGLSGSALAGPADFVQQARAWRHRYGGEVFRQWPVALTALAGLDTQLPRLEKYVAHAAPVAEALAGLPGARVHPVPPHTRQFQFWLPYPAARLNEAVLLLAEEEKVWFCGGWRDRQPPGMAMAEVTIGGAALEWSAADVTAVGEAFLRLLSR